MIIFRSYTEDGKTTRGFRPSTILFRDGNLCLSQNKANYFRSIILFQDARTRRSDINVRRFLKRENMAEGLIMTVLKENNIELSENDLKQG